MAEKYIYSHVAIIGLDGMGNYNKNADTPFMDKIFSGYAETYDALSLYPTISAQNWGAMLLGADPEVHGLTNSIVSEKVYENKELPSIFTTVRKYIPDSVLCSVSDWSPINHGIIEHDVGAELQTAENGEKTTDKVVECVISKKPTLLFVQIDDPDGAGHSFGYGTEKHLECIHNTDKLVNRIYEAYREAGIIDDTLFIVITDHGGYGHGHGGYSEGEKYIYFALRGKTVKNTKGFFAQTKDINAVVRHAFGIDIPAFDRSGYSSQIPKGVFNDCDDDYVTFTSERYDVEQLPTPAIDGKDGLYSFFSKDDIRAAMFFDNNVSDETGKLSFDEYGKVKYYSTGCRGSMAEFGVTGYLENDEMSFGTDDFSIAAWFKVDGAPGCYGYVCGMKAKDDSSSGFMLWVSVVSTIAAIESGKGARYEEFESPFYREVSGGWIHAVYSFNRSKNTVDVYHNFKLKDTFTFPEEFKAPIGGKPFTIGEDITNMRNKDMNVLFNMDDFILFDKALSEDDVKKLASYYRIDD
ncbi:MAG: alkaline phosphatase family protein [Clostridiales bacterium]|nr:alkaline phosphatase family protein [Clostridiales bacterium]